jgi:hypothetical protein
MISKPFLHTHIEYARHREDGLLTTDLFSRAAVPSVSRLIPKRYDHPTKHVLDSFPVSNDALEKPSALARNLPGRLVTGERFALGEGERKL